MFDSKKQIFELNNNINYLIDIIQKFIINYEKNIYL